MSKWVQGTVVARRQWTAELYSLQVAAPEVTFVAGQFGRLALPMTAAEQAAAPSVKDGMLGRPYSFVNAPATQPHEFYFIIVPAGPLSPRLATLEAGEPVSLLPTGNGFFSVTETAEADVLWLLATGTGLGPYLSILRTELPWQKYARVVLVHAVRHANELTYRDTIAGIATAHPGAFACISVVSRESHPDALLGRIPALIDDGRLEARAGIALSAENSHVMLCGNPAMVDDVQKVLATRSMRRHRRKEPGHITVETYW